MILQALLMAVVLMFWLQMMLFFCSGETSLKAAYADSWRKTGTVVERLFQLQSGPDQGITVVAFSTVGFYVAIGAALDIAARFSH